MTAQTVKVLFVCAALLANGVANADELWSPTTYEKLDRKPALTVSPQYPEKAWEQRRQGRVVVCFRIRADGKVVKPYVLTSTSRVFNKGAIRAMRASRFEPTTDPRRPDQEACRTFRFLLEPASSSRLQ